jgi:hypothetical protein
MQFGGDRERDALRRLSAEVESDGAPQARRQGARQLAELTEQAFTPRPRAEQAEVRDCASRERAQVRRIRGQVVAHDDRGMERPEVDPGRELVGAGLNHGRAGEARRIRIRGAMIDHGDRPLQRAQLRDDRLGIRACAADENPRRRRQVLDPRLARHLLALPAHALGCTGEKHRRAAAGEHRVERAVRAG